MDFLDQQPVNLVPNSEIHSHRRMSLAMYQCFLHLEQTFFSSLSTAQIQVLTCNGTLQVHDSQLHGEFAFLVTGLKPCLLICFPSPELNQLFAQTVLDKVLQHQSRFQVHSISRSLASDEMDLRGCVLVVDQESSLAPMWMKTIGDEKCSSISEHTLAQLLDYPGSLPSCSEELDTMLEVAYFDISKSIDNPTLMTTFAAQKNEVEDVKLHFERYRTSVKELGIDLRLSIRDPQS